MRSKKTLIILAAAFVLLIVGAYALYNSFGDALQMEQLSTVPKQTTTATEDAQETTTAADTQLAPDFTVYNADGKAYQLSDFRGKPVILNFWASWCGPCKSEMPDFETVYKQYGEDIHFLFVNLTDGAQETVESASAFIKEAGYTFPVYYDSDISAATAYSVWSIPTTYFIDAQGYGVAWASGAIDFDTIMQGIGMILP